MPSNGDESLLRRLAITFGEGLIFSIATRLMDDAMRPKDAMPAPDFAPLTDRLGRIEQQLGRLEVPRERAPEQPAGIDRRAVQVIVVAVEKHLEEHALRVQQRMDALQASISSTAQSAASKQIEQESIALRAEIRAMRLEMAGSVARIVAEQVEARAASMEALIQEQIQAAVVPLQSEIQEFRRRVGAGAGSPGGAAPADSAPVPEDPPVCPAVESD